MHTDVSKTDDLKKSVLYGNIYINIIRIMLNRLASSMWGMCVWELMFLPIMFAAYPL